MNEEEAKALFSGMLEEMKDSLREELKQEAAENTLNPEEEQALKDGFFTVKQSFAEQTASMDGKFSETMEKMDALHNRFTELTNTLNKVSDGQVYHSEANGDDYGDSNNSRNNVF